MSTHFHPNMIFTTTCVAFAALVTFVSAIAIPARPQDYVVPNPSHVVFIPPTTRYPVRPTPHAYNTLTPQTREDDLWVLKKIAEQYHPLQRRQAEPLPTKPPELPHVQPRSYEQLPSHPPPRRPPVQRRRHEKPPTDLRPRQLDPFDANTKPIDDREWSEFDVAMVKSQVYHFFWHDLPIEILEPYLPHGEESVLKPYNRERIAAWKLFMEDWQRFSLNDKRRWIQQNIKLFPADWQVQMYEVLEALGTEEFEEFEKAGKADHHDGGHGRGHDGEAQNRYHCSVFRCKDWTGHPPN